TRRRTTSTEVTSRSRRWCCRMSWRIGCAVISPAITSMSRSKSAAASGTRRPRRRKNLADPPGFLERWSRLKRADRTKEKHGAKLDEATSPAPPERVTAPESDDPLQDLPAIDSLTKDSDFSLFMQPGVPEELRNQALRKLWSS